MAIAGIVLLGIALRTVAAHGGLWTDEAWSVVYAAQAGDPLGVFLRINHDNNHHLNSLWLQAIGPAAPPMLARVPAICAGSLCIFVAALIARRKSFAGGLVAATLFAVSPVLVIFGSEARGYAMMLLFALLMFFVVDGLVHDQESGRERWWLAALALLGMFSHLTMIAPILVAVLWFYLEQRAKGGPERALKRTIELMGPALAVAASVLLFVAIAAAASPMGMRVGGYTPFTLGGYSEALDDLGLWSAGLSAPWPWLGPVILGSAAFAIGLKAPPWLGPRARLYALLILFVPVAAGVLRVGNSSFSRYYLTSAIGLLLFMSDWIARGLSSRASVRATTVVLLVMVIGVSLYRDAILIALDRGRPAASVQDMAAIAPKGARVALPQPRLEAVVRVAAARRGYPLAIARGCAPADFLLDAQSPGTAAPAQIIRCGVRMNAIDSSVTVPLTGDSWILYQAGSLQTARGADSGRPPGDRNRRLIGRAGVAQG